MAQDRKSKKLMITKIVKLDNAISDVIIEKQEISYTELRPRPKWKNARLVGVGRGSIPVSIISMTFYFPAFEKSMGVKHTVLPDNRDPNVKRTAVWPKI